MAKYDNMTTPTKPTAQERLTDLQKEIGRVWDKSTMTGTIQRNNICAEIGEIIAELNESTSTVPVREVKDYPKAPEPGTFLVGKATHVVYMAIKTPMPVVANNTLSADDFCAVVVATPDGRPAYILGDFVIISSAVLKNFDVLPKGTTLTLTV